MRRLLVALLWLSLGQAVGANAAPQPRPPRMPAAAWGKDKKAPAAASWSAAKGPGPGDRVSGPGVSAVEDARLPFAARAFTFEAWLRWPEEAAGKLQPEIIAEAQGAGWSWILGFDEVGSPYLRWRHGQAQFQARGEISYDIIQPGRWYHLAVVFNAPEQHDGQGDRRTEVLLYFTEEGAKRPFCVGINREGITPGGAPAAPARLAVGRGVSETTAGVVRVGSAAFYAAARMPDNPDHDKAPARLPPNARPLPKGITADADFEMGSLGQIGMTAEGVILFEPKAHESRNYWYAFRIQGAKGRRLVFQAMQVDAMMIAPNISEDGGKTWVRPSEYTHRRVNSGDSTHLSFAHAFGADEAIVGGSPMVTTSAAGHWLDDVAARKLGAKIHIIGKSPEGRPLRVAEIGNPDAPLVYLQAGQHSGMERFGFFLITSAFEEAAKDSELLKKTRWLILPVVNVDSYMVMPKPGDPNMNRVWRASDTHPTVSSIRRFLEQESARTGALAAWDVHAGTVWRGHALPGVSVAGLFERYAGEQGMVFDIRRPPAMLAPRELLAPPPPAPADLRNWHPGAGSLTFGGFAAELPGVRAAYTLELALLAERTSEGAGPVSAETLRRDGVRLCRTLKKLADAPAH